MYLYYIDEIMCWCGVIDAEWWLMIGDPCAMDIWYMIYRSLIYWWLMVYRTVIRVENECRWPVRQFAFMSHRSSLSAIRYTLYAIYSIIASLPVRPKIGLSKYQLVRFMTPFPLARSLFEWMNAGMPAPSRSSRLLRSRNTCLIRLY